MSTDRDPYAAARASAAVLAERTGRARHEVLVVLGSGWGPAAEALGEPAVELAMTDLPGFHAPVAEGHAGTVASVLVGGVPTLVYAGRTHLYEGHGPVPVVHGMRVAAAAGVRAAVLTNANGSLRDDWQVGQAVLVADHLNLTGVSPLVGPRFVDLTDAWSARLRGLARAFAPALDEGVYAMLRGPHYETWAEAEWLRRVGGDMLGMSTVLEAVAARELGIELLGLSTVTAIEGQPSGIDPAEVVAVAERTAKRLGPLIAGVIQRL
ncbi:purine nucleoside phosphorylase [Intrasporangium chromatireducens Q5-1]|uniref:Purine nucleoside phosphorylase n=1 Tax=Intrasporangium chromatireducens Q5-1 TaxID=584657 RepID=W9GLX3_9MICO|nr:purine-nucleoside phosphorylase [Intrasporangium chromatireducens]EWT04899.1 purine nucleoside phosphorylase [Intrasporangium chromatireducens Q5-1]